MGHPVDLEILIAGLHGHEAAPAQDAGHGVRLRGAGQGGAREVLGPEGGSEAPRSHGRTRPLRGDWPHQGKRLVDSSS